LSTSSPRFGIAVQGDKTPAEYVAQAQLIDRYPFEVVSVYNDLFFQPAIGPLLVMVPHLHRAHMGPAALNPYTLHPVEIAGQIAFLDQLTGGRAYLGLVRGAWLDQIGICQTRPLGTLRRAICTIKQLLSGHTLRYKPLRPQIPITVGTWGVRTAQLVVNWPTRSKSGARQTPKWSPCYVRPYQLENALPTERRVACGFASAR
jgi:5,10-methylenetetrahydromethanopterin reductase